MPDVPPHALDARVHEVTLPLIQEVALRLGLDQHALALVTAALTLAAAEGVRAGAEEVAGRAAEHGLQLDVPVATAGTATLDELCRVLLREMGLDE